MDIVDWRDKIDEIDSRILELLNRRADFCNKIGEIKAQRGIPIHSPDREKLIIERTQEENGGPLSNEGVRRIFERIIDESRKLEKDVAKAAQITQKEG